MYDPRHDPVIKGAAAAWHNLFDHAANCDRFAEHADPARMTVTDDYPAARQQLHTALEGRALHEVHEAAQRFQAAVTTTPLDQVIASGARENELQLMEAVLMLRSSMTHLDDALSQLDQLYPDEEP